MGKKLGELSERTIRSLPEMPVSAQVNLGGSHMQWILADGSYYSDVPRRVPASQADAIRSALLTAPIVASASGASTPYRQLAIVPAADGSTFEYAIGDRRWASQIRIGIPGADAVEGAGDEKLIPMDVLMQEADEEADEEED